MTLADERRVEALQGRVLGTAAGDAVGLPFEKLSRAAVARLMALPLEHSLVARRGLVSDDTERTGAVVARR